MSKWFLGLLMFAAVGAEFPAIAQGKTVPKEVVKDGGLTTSGFLDVQMQWSRGELDLNGQAVTSYPGEPSGFSVYQGAMMLTDEFKKAEFVLDIPFRQKSTETTKTMGTATVTESTNDFELATKEAQAYVKYQYDLGIFWQLGQFDSPFGLEGNDSVDMIFPRFGIMKSLTPNTHTGLLIGYAFLPFHLNVIIANGDSRGLQDDDQSQQYGVRMGWSQEPLQAAVGLLYTRTDGNYFLNNGETPSYKPNFILNGVVTSVMRKLEVSFEGNIIQSRLGRANTVNGPKDHELVFGALAQGVYNWSDKFSVGLRYEYIKNDETNEYVTFANAATNAATPVNTLTGQGGYLSKISIAARKIMSEELAAKAGIELNNINIGQDSPSEGKTQSWTVGSLGVVYQF